MLKALFRLPYWAYFVLAITVVGLAILAERQHVATQQEKARALTQGAPELVDLSEFRLAQNIGLADEVNVTGWINADLNTNLVKRKNGIKTGERFMYVLFGDRDGIEGGVARAALVLTEAEKDRFIADIDTYLTGVNDRGPVVAVNGMAQFRDTYADQALKAITREGLYASADFLFLTPYWDGREAALGSVEAMPYPLKQIALALAAVLALIGAARFRRSGAPARRQAENETAAESMRRAADEFSIPSSAPILPVPDSETPVERLDRLRREAQLRNGQGHGHGQGQGHGQEQGRAKDTPVPTQPVAEPVKKRKAPARRLSLPVRIPTVSLGYGRKSDPFARLANQHRA